MARESDESVSAVVEAACVAFRARLVESLRAHARAFAATAAAELPGDAPARPARRAKVAPRPPRAGKRETAARAKARRRACGCAATGRHKAACADGRAKADPEDDDAPRAGRAKGARPSWRERGIERVRREAAGWARPLRRCNDCDVLVWDVESELRRHRVQAHREGGAIAVERVLASYGPPSAPGGATRTRTSA